MLLQPPQGSHLLRYHWPPARSDELHLSCWYPTLPCHCLLEGFHLLHWRPPPKPPEESHRLFHYEPSRLKASIFAAAGILPGMPKSSVSSIATWCQQGLLRGPVMSFAVVDLQPSHQSVPSTSTNFWPDNRGSLLVVVAFYQAS